MLVFILPSGMSPEGIAKKFHLLLKVAACHADGHMRLQAQLLYRVEWAVLRLRYQVRHLLAVEFFRDGHG